MADTHSKLAVALADCILSNDQAWPFRPTPAHREIFASLIDERLAEIREHYKPEELNRCPVVSHCGSDRPCAFCITAAMREFILLPEDLNA